MSTHVTRRSFWLTLLSAAVPLYARGASAQSTAIEEWTETEIAFTARKDRANPYTDVDSHATFTGPGGAALRRPAFWDGGRTWKVRFAPPAVGTWRWAAVCSDATDAGLHGRIGTLVARHYRGANPLLKRGLLKMSANRRNVVHHDGTPFMMVADTPWALPWRGTVESVTAYARDRRAKDFNAALLMSVQPDRDARGPRDRVSIGGFDRGFEDLPDGHLNRPHVAYFQYLDQMANILIEHGIVPVWQPVFQGFGWKGQRVLGDHAVPEEYARYCRYLVARYGARPAMWLVSADSTGLQPCVEAGGREVEACDAYRQPTGIHYNPFDDYRPANQPRENCFHHNRSHQAAAWLDFQWCQTGHGGAHDARKVSLMHDNQPTKAVANGEPTYEAVRDAQNGAGWWQGHEAWLQLTAGGTMGVVYGAGGLWHWKLFPDEPGWPRWADSPGNSWREALRLEGSRLVGHVAKAFAGYDFADMTKHPELAGGKLCVATPGEFYVVYLPEGGDVIVSGLRRALPFAWFDPRAGAWAGGGKTVGASFPLHAPSARPWVLIVGEKRGK